MPGLHQIETLLETTIAEAAVPVEVTGCTWPVPVDETVCTSLSMSGKRSNNDDDSQTKHQFSSNIDCRVVKRYKSEKITSHCQEEISETMKTGRDETVQVRERIEGVLDKFLGDYKKGEDTKAAHFDLGEEDKISEEESIENIQKFLDEWKLTSSDASLN